MAMAAYLAMALFLSLTSPLISTSYGDTGDQTHITDAESPKNCSDPDNNLVCQIEEMKLEVARSEFLLEVANLELQAKSSYIEISEKKIEELSRNIRKLESVLSNLEANNKDMSGNEQLLNALEEEASRVETMSKVVPELWFHVQKLEQACEVIERRTAELRKHIRNQKCSFFKFINSLSGYRHQKLVSAYTTEAVNQLRRSFSALKKYHHQLQEFVKEEMEKNEVTAILADETELIFFLASAIIVFPLMLALIWLLSHSRY